VPDRYLGQTIGKYRVIRLLGAGACAWVYEAVDLDLEIPVALKVLRPEFAGQEVAETRFKREAATAAKLRHPNIVTVRDVGQVDGAAFVAMDLYPLTLGRRLALIGRLPESEVVRLGLGMAAALATAHASGVIHRDIKPDNILLDADGEAVVADFGLARALAGSASVSATHQVLGTPQYFSPEQARGLDLDGRSDLYALGVTLYRAATGTLPFDGEDWYAVARQHIEQPPPPPRDRVAELTPEFERLVLKLLAKEPGARFANAVQVVDALAALPTSPDRRVSLPRLDSHTIEAFRPPSKSRAPLAAAFVLVGVTGIVAWLALRGTGVPSWTARVDSALRDTLRRDTVRVVGPDTIAIPMAVTPRPDSAKRTAPPRPRPAPATIRVELSATDSAALYVDNRLVGAGRWSGEVPASSRLQLHAVVPDAPTSCPTSRADTVFTQLKAGQRVAVELAVRGCAVVRYTVQPRDARVLFQSLDGGAPVETRADSAASLLVPLGRYLMRISAPRCVPYSDTVAVSRRMGETPVPRKLFCPEK
jgi:eukaryotic-like serine/threonine-protein kinase